MAITTAAAGQATLRPTPAPLVSAAIEPWFIKGEAIFFENSFYFPAGPKVFFDGNVMTRVGHFQGIPVYADVTLEQFSMVFVPIGNSLMQPYERRRTGELAGTVGSRTPSFPVVRDFELTGQEQVAPPGLPFAATLLFPGTPNVATTARAPVVTAPGATGVTAPAGSVTAMSGTRRSTRPRPVAEARPAPPAPVGTTGVVPMTPPRGTGMTFPRARRTGAIWLMYQGRRWQSAGEAVPYTADRFVRVGEHRGFGVYAARGARPGDLIYLDTTLGGGSFVTPYRLKMQ